MYSYVGMFLYVSVGRRRLFDFSSRFPSVEGHFVLNTWQPHADHKFSPSLSLSHSLLRMVWKSILIDTQSNAGNMEKCRNNVSVH